MSIYILWRKKEWVVLDGCASRSCVDARLNARVGLNGHACRIGSHGSRGWAASADWACVRAGRWACAWLAILGTCAHWVFACAGPLLGMGWIPGLRFGHACSVRARTCLCACLCACRACLCLSARSACCAVGHTCVAVCTSWDIGLAGGMLACVEPTLCSHERLHMRISRVSMPRLHPGLLLGRDS